MCGAAFYRPLWPFTGEEPVDQARRKGIASAHSIENVQVFAVLRLIKIAIAVADRAPIVSRCCFCLSQSGRDHVERILLHYLLDHLLESVYFEVREISIHSRNFVAQRR